MTISYNWLMQYLRTEITPEEVSVILTDIGLEVDRFEKTEGVKGGLLGVVVGEVLTCEKHPDADKLSITTVAVGGEEPLQIVCGAPNVAAGQKVMVATVNTTLYPVGETEEGFKIKRSKIRGVESLGMICAEDELGIGKSHDGIMVLDPKAVVGTPAADYLKIENDYIIEIGLTPNRVDAASHYGVARDLAAYLKANGRSVELVKPSVEEFKAEAKGREVAVEVADSLAAPRYCGVTMEGVKVGQSPEWLQKHLRAIGINPKNNIVDITNFVMHETGQPLHAFDADKIDGGRIVVRKCEEGTKFVTLDGVERKLSGEDLMICSASKPMCIAGVFGGLDSGVSESTTSIFIESAYFNPVTVRKSARRHGLNTDSSFRFERGADPNMALYALKRAALLVRELAGGMISSKITDIYPQEIEPFRFELSFERANRVIGKEIPQETVLNIIRSLDVEVVSETVDGVEVAVPPYRVDVQREIDLIEDILRIYGFNNIEIPTRLNSSLAYAPKPDMHKLTNLVADMLSAQGYTEIMSNSLTKASYYEGCEAYPVDKCVRIINPLSTDLSVMRQTLIFNAMEAIELNVNRKKSNLKMYEFGNCYYYDAAKSAEGGLAPYSEVQKLALVVTGAQNEVNWNNAKPAKSDFFYLRAALEKVLRRFGIDIYSLRCETLKSDLFGDAITMSLNGKELVQMGSVAAKIRKLFDMKNEVYFLEMNFDLLVHATRKHTVSAEELSKYPEVERDLALLVDKEVTFSQLRNLAHSTEKKLLKSVALFDVYEGDKLPQGKKSYALKFILEDKTQTLNDKMIDKVMSSLIARFEKECGAVVRS